MTSPLFDWDFGVSIAPTLAKKKTEASLQVTQLQHSTPRLGKANNNAKSLFSTLLRMLKIVKNQFVPKLPYAPLCSWGAVRRAAGGGSRIPGGNPHTLKGTKVPCEEPRHWEGVSWRARPRKERPDRP